MADRSRRVDIVDYNPQWPEWFRQEKLRILGVIRHQAIAVEHIGSTAVTGLVAKPIIDVMVGLHRYETLVKCIPRLGAIGYEYVPHFELITPFRRFFHKGRDGQHTHHLHLVESTHPFWEQHLIFRNVLRTHPRVRQEYAVLKRQLAHRFRYDIAAYSKAKSPFIRSVELRARRELQPLQQEAS